VKENPEQFEGDDGNRGSLVMSEDEDDRVGGGLIEVGE